MSGCILKIARSNVTLRDVTRHSRPRTVWKLTNVSIMELLSTASSRVASSSSRLSATFVSTKESTQARNLSGNFVWIKNFPFKKFVINNLLVFEFSCEMCDKSFRNSHHLKSHMLSHTGERPYACSDSSCGRKFTKRNSWKSHQAKHNKGVDSAGQSSDETIGRQVLNSVNPDEIRLTTVPSVDGVQGKF